MSKRFYQTEDGTIVFLNKINTITLTVSYPTLFKEDNIYTVAMDNGKTFSIKEKDKNGILHMWLDEVKNV
jgi:hypothetical protein